MFLLEMNATHIQVPGTLLFFEVTATYIQIAGTFLFFIAIAWLLAEFKGMKDEIQERLGINNETIKLKLQAYERLTLYAERAGLKNLVSRTHAEDMTAGQMQLGLLQTLNEEYEYNVSQQIYVSAQMWKAITKLRDQNIFIINQIAATLPAQASSMELSKALLEYSMNNNAEINKIVLEALHFEAQKVLKSSESKPLPERS
jgi:2C-methyl-D-erythritol 2,4-cyclodiphosphate synthase